MSMTSWSDAESRMPVSVATAIDDAGLTPTHLLIFGICFLTSLVDGFDTQMVGFSAGSMAAEMHLSLAAFGPIFAATAAGSLFGSAALGALADRVGRRRSLILSTALFALPTLLSLGAGGARDLMLLRFVAGIGLGGAMPGVLTLVSEYAPLRHRGLATSALWCGYPCGGLLAGGLGSAMLSTHGWRPVFLAGGLLALATMALQIVLLPESLRFLETRVDGGARILSTMARLAPGRPIDLSARRSRAAAAPLSLVLAPGRRLVAALIWMPLVCTFLIAGFFVLWLPPLFQQVGYTASTVAFLVALNNLAAAPSQALAGWLIDRVGAFGPVVAGYFGMAAAILIVAAGMSNSAVVAGAVLALGLLQGPGIAGMIHIATQTYPPPVRSTGVGLALGMGRLGLVFGSVLVGLEVRGGMPPATVVASVAAPALVAAAAVIVLRRLSLEPRRCAGETPMTLPTTEDGGLR